MAKNIVVFSDGTGQKGGIGTNTNVYKLFNMVEDRTQRQIVFYDPGLGTNWQRISGSVAGNGFTKNLKQCYQFIFENFEADDQIFLFGFSRGAATVRSLSGFIHLFGVLPKSRPDLIDKAYKIYQIRDKKKREAKAQEFIKKHHNMWCKIKFLGVWDTVAALGLPNKYLSIVLDSLFPHRFHSFELSESVVEARQALAIDEDRKTFSPVLWDPLDKTDRQERLKQVWFCGVHTDVGGGYPEQDLSDISLKWMIDEALDHGLYLYKKSHAWKRLNQSKFDVNGIMHDERNKFPGILFRKMERNWDSSKHGNPDIHPSVSKRTLNRQNENHPPYNPWILTD